MPPPFHWNVRLPVQARDHSRRRVSERACRLDLGVPERTAAPEGVTRALQASQLLPPLLQAAHQIHVRVQLELLTRPICHQNGTALHDGRLLH